MGPVRRSNLDETRAGATHHVRDPEGAADLDQLTPGHQHLPAGSKGCECQQHCGSIVVDDGRRLGSSDLPQQRLHQIVAIATAASVQIVLEGARIRGSDSHRLDRRGRKQCSTQIRVQDSAGKVDDRAKAGPNPLFGQPGNPRRQRFAGRQGGTCLNGPSGRIQFDPDTVGDEVATVRPDHRPKGWFRQ